VEEKLQNQDSTRNDLMDSLRSLEEAKRITIQQLAEEQHTRALLEERFSELEATSSAALAEEHRLRMEAEESLRGVRNAISGELEAERRERFEIAGQLHNAQQFADQFRVVNEDYRDLKAKYESLLQELNSAKAARDKAESECQELQRLVKDSSQATIVQQQLAASHAAIQQDLVDKIQDLELRLRPYDNEEPTWADRHAAMQKQYQELARQKSQLETMYDDLAVDRDELIETVDAQRRQIAELQTHLDEQTTALSSQTATTSEMMELRDQLHFTQLALQHSRVQLAAAIKLREQAIAERDDVRMSSTAIEEELQHHQRALEALNRSHEKSVAQLVKFDARRNELEQLVREHEHTVDTLRDDLRELNVLRQQCVSLQADLRVQTQEFNVVRLDRDVIARQLADSLSATEALQQRTGGYQRELDEVRQQREELLASLTREKIQNDELSNALREQSNRLELISRQLKQMESLQSELEELQVANEQLAQEIGQIGAERDAFAARSTESTEMLDQLRRQLANSHQSIVALERDRDQAIAQLRRQNVMLESQLAHADPVATPHFEIRSSQQQNEQLKPVALLTHQTCELERLEQPLQRDERRGLIYEQPPEKRDDLKRISGIASVLEKRLNEFGIYTYRQIMDWDQVAVAEFSRLLAFRDRILRDDWIGQARQLHAEKYGKAA
jgi:predicted flap endonuclease-1-like 5' DNA nuclease